MKLKGRMLSCGAACLALTPSGWSQSASPWRVFKAVDGLPEAACVSITVSPQGTVLARHLKAASVTKLDGYDLSLLPAPPTAAGRVYESPAGQLWAAAAEGLQEFRDGQWVLHPVPEIAAEIRSSGGHLPHGVPLCAVRHGRVLFLLRDRLMALNVESPDRAETEVLRRAGQTRLGAFLGMTAARDGGLWISGTRGLAKLPGPARNLKADTEWLEFELPESLKVQNLRAPLDDEAAGVTTIAQSATGGDPVVVRFDGQHWTTWSAGSEPIRFAWRGPQQTSWAATTNALFSRREDSGEFNPDDETSARKFFDVATEPGGAFWLATLDGLFRYAPPCWNTPAAARALRSPVLAVAQDGEGRLWCVAGGELHLLREHDHQAFPFPEALRRRLQTVRALIPLANGVFLFDTDGQLLRFQPASGACDPIVPGSGGRQVKFLGVLNDGTACLHRFNPDGTAAESGLEIYDGDQTKPFPAGSPLPPVGRTLLTLFQARNGDLWLSGDQGVARLRDGQWKAFPAANETGPEAALFFAEATDGRVWAATVDKLWVFDGRDWALVRPGFDRINALVRSHDDSLWVASNSGLHRLTPAGWIENGVEEGLPGAAVRSVCEDRRGRLWAGTGLGLSLYHPEADPDPPRTEIAAPSDQLILEGGSITLAFQGQDKWKFTPRKRLLYSLRLDDRDWSPFLELNTVTFPELPAGSHSFQVRAMDRNGNIETKPAQITFAVALPWFKETRLVVIATLGAVVALFFAALAFNRHWRLRRSYAEVERKVAERTRELEIASRQLVHSQKMNALGTLAAGIAHDFNNILSIIKGSAQIIEDNLGNPQKVHKRVDRIKTVVEQGAGIVQAMLGFSRTSEESPGPCDLNAVAADTITLLGDRFLREVEVSFDPAPDLPPVPVPKDFVQQILLNFIFNAAESITGRKRVVLTMNRLEKLPASLVLKPSDADGYVSISVRDSGCGISPENLPRIFEPFFTTKALSKRRGTGLGLSMVYELATRMNVGLAVESVVGQGSTFTLILPVQAAPT